MLFRSPFIPVWICKLAVSCLRTFTRDKFGLQQPMSVCAYVYLRGKSCRHSQCNNNPELKLLKLSRWLHWKFLGQTVASGCKGFPTFRALSPSLSSGCAGYLVAPKQLVVSFGATKPPAHPEYGGGVSARNVGKPHLDTSVYPRIVHWTQGLLSYHHLSPLRRVLSTMCEVTQLVNNVFLFYKAWRSETVLRRESENSTPLLQFIFPWDQFQHHLCVDLPSFISLSFLLHAVLVSCFCVWSTISGWRRRRIICVNLLRVLPLSLLLLPSSWVQTFSSLPRSQTFCINIPLFGRFSSTNVMHTFFIL